MAKEKPITYSLGQVPTQVATVIKKGDDQNLSLEEAIVQVLNDLEELKRGLL